MNYKLRLALTCILAFSSSVSNGADLLEVYKTALTEDPLLREADATRLANREARPQAWAALLPQITGSAGYDKAKSEGTSEEPGLITAAVPDDPVTPGIDESQPAVFGLVSSPSETETTDKSWGITLSQSLFNWSRIAQLGLSKSQVAQAEINYRASQQDLIARVARRYFDVLAAKAALDASNAASEAFARQLEQFEKRFEVGLIAITDVQDARAARDRASADVISAKRTYATNLELLREITGDAVNNLEAPGDDMPLPTPNPASEDRWVASALEQNLTLIATRLNAEIFESQVSIARGGHYPTLDLSATRGNRERESAIDRAETAQRDASSTTTLTDSDSTTLRLSLNVPIFSSGATQSRVRQAVYNYRAARERTERVTRETERAARDNYLGVVSNIARVQALKQAYESSQTAMQATEAGFEVGTRTTVDVLLSRQSLYSAQTAYERSKYDYINSLILLKQAAGMLNESDIVEINGWLK
jgi:outer membrane protein